jgi:hypothetical protein
VNVKEKPWLCILNKKGTHRSLRHVTRTEQGAVGQGCLTTPVSAVGCASQGPTAGGEKHKRVKCKTQHMVVSLTTQS